MGSTSFWIFLLFDFFLEPFCGFAVSFFSNLPSPFRNSVLNSASKPSSISVVASNFDIDPDEITGSNFPKEFLQDSRLYITC